MKPSLSVIIPALNEDKNILLTIENALSALKEFDILGEIIVVNDGSADFTAALVEKKIKESPDIVRMITHLKPQGIGVSFWDGVKGARGGVVVMIPGDNENDLGEILCHYELIKKADMVTAFIVNKGARSFFRKALSSLYRFIVNTSFRTNFKYTNGVTLYRKVALEKSKQRSKGFFYQADILIRLTKLGCSYLEVPCRLGERKGGRSKAITLRALRDFLGDYLRLVKDCYFTRSLKGNYEKTNS